MRGQSNFPELFCQAIFQEILLLCLVLKLSGHDGLGGTADQGDDNPRWAGGTQR